jgi:hypothetical protein
VLEAGFILLEFPSPSRRIFIGSHSLPPIWFAESVLRKGRKLSKNLSGLSCFARDGFGTMALSSGSKKSHQSDSDSDSEDEVRDELPFFRQENEWLGLLLDNHDDMLIETKKMG